MKVQITKAPSVNQTLKPVAREDANLEAEQGEVAMTPGKGGIPNTYKIGGNRHSNGGTPLQLEPESFIFSDTPKMKIKDEDILKSFEMGGKKGGYTPAEIAKKYNINKYKEILLNPNTDKMHKETAERMIENYNLKLGEIALVQESMKGLPDGIPLVAMPYLEATGLDIASLLPQPKQQSAPRQLMQGEQPMMRMGGSTDKRRVVVNLPKAQQGDVVKGVKPPAESIYTTKEDAIAAKKANPKLDTYYKTGDGKLKRIITNPAFTLSDTGKNKPIPTIEEATKAKTILDGMVTRGTATVDEEGIYYIKGTAGDDKDLSLANQDLLTKVLGNTTTIINPKSTKKNNYMGYQNIENPKSNILISNQSVNQKRGTYGFVSPDLLEYRYYLLMNNKISPDEFKNLPEDVKLKNRQKYFERIGKTGITKDTPLETLYTPDNMSKMVKNIETQYEDEKGYRPGAGNEQRLGMDHVDDMTYEPEFTDEDYTVSENSTETPIIKDPGEPYVNVDYAPWWMQDKIKTAGAAMDMARIKKYTPWQGVPNVVTPDPTFYDPERELAANAEQANIAAQELSQFTGPQAFNARYNQVQSAGADNIANVMSRYNNLNVGVANQFETTNTGILNQASQQKAGADTALYDKYTIVNQQFDNAKNMARQNLRQSYIDAITNRQQTQNLNSLYDDYIIDPNDGGSLNFKPGAMKIKPGELSKTLQEQANEIKNVMPNVSDDVLLKYLTGAK